MNRVGDLNKEQQNRLVVGRGSLANSFRNFQQETDIEFLISKCRRAVLYCFVQLYEAFRDREAKINELANAGYTTDHIHYNTRRSNA